MRRPLYWMVILFLLCLLSAYGAAAGGGHGGGTSADDQGYSSGQSGEAQGQGGGSPASGDTGSGPGDSSAALPGSDADTHGSGATGTGDQATPGNEGQGGDAAPAGNEDPMNVMTGSGSGDADRAPQDQGVSDESTASHGAGLSAGPGSRAATGVDPDRGEQSKAPDSDTREGPSGPVRGENDHPQAGSPGEQESPGQGSPKGWEGVRVMGNSAWQALGADPVPGRNGMQESFGLGTASAIGAGMMRSGTDGPSPPYGPQGPSPYRHTGMPAGNFPCAPAETTPVIPAKEPRENGKEDTLSRPRSKRQKLIPLGEGTGEPPDSSGLPLSPFSLFLFGGYRRISRKNVLDQTTRNRIYTMIAGYPGTDVTAITGVTGINENTVRYHLMKLIANGKIVYLSHSGVVRYYPNQGSYPLPEQTLLHYLWTETPREIILLLASHPGMTRQQVSDALAISGPSVTRQMDHLINDNIVENRGSGRANQYHLTEGTKQTLEHLALKTPRGQGLDALWPSPPLARIMGSPALQPAEIEM